MDHRGPYPILPAGLVGEPEAAPTRFRRTVGAIALAVLIAGVASSVFGGLAWTSHANSQSTRAFDAAASTQADAISIALQRDADLAATARALVQTTPRLSNTSFATWFRLLGTRDSYHSSFGLLYLEKVPASGLSRFEARAGSDPPLGLPVDGRFTITPPSRGPYCLTRLGVVQLSSSTGLDPAELGGLIAFTRADLNYCALPIGSLLNETGATGSPAVVTLASLVRHLGQIRGLPPMPARFGPSVQQSGLLAAIYPVFMGATGHTALNGWILGIYQAANILEPAIATRHESAVLSFVNPSGKATVLARVGSESPSMVRQRFRFSSSGTWELELAALPTVSGLSPTEQGLVIGVGGIVCSILLFLLIGVLSRSRTRALRVVEERTAQLRHLALHDGLTSLANRDLIFNRAEQFLARAQRTGGEVACLFVDLDQFKDVNDSHGHGAGDELLVEVAARFTGALDKDAVVGRLGGDEFVVLVELTKARSAAQAAQALIASLREPFILRGESHKVSLITASVGIATARGGSAIELLRDADIALYEAKARQRGGYVEFRPSMRDAIAKRVQLEADLRRAIRRQEFFVVYQPVFSLEDDRLCGVEALLRWQHPSQGVVLPAAFVPSLEATGAIVDVGRFVLDESCRQAASWMEMGYPLSVAVNVSGRQLDQEGFVLDVKRALEKSRLTPDLLTLEITETSLMRNVELSTRRLVELKSLGVRLSIDDFGTGYCSLAYLGQFPVDAVKIDQSFVSRMDRSPEGAALVHTIVQMGRDLSLEIVAEGIETPRQLAQLRDERCTNGQGFLLARPLAACSIDQLVADVRRAQRVGASGRSS